MRPFLLAFGLLATAPIASQTPSDKATSATPMAHKLRAATGADGLRLAQVAALARTPLRAVRIQKPVISDNGEVLGQVRFGAASCRAMLHGVRTGISDRDQAWVLAIEVDSSRLSQLIPSLAGSIVDGLRLANATLVVATQDLRVTHDAISKQAATFYTKRFGTKRVLLDLGFGLNILTPFGAASASPAGWTLNRLGIRTKGLLLQGSILKGASFEELKAAKKDKKLGRRIRESLELRAFLPPISLRGLPTGFRSGRASLIVTGKPGIGVGFRLTTAGKTAAATRDFECVVKVEKGNLGATELKILGISDGLWRNAFGIRGFNLSEARLLLGIDNQQKVSFGLRANMGIGSKRIALAGKLQLRAVTGAPTGGFFEGRLNSLGSRDLIVLANSIANVRGRQRNPVRGNAIPEFELRKLYLKVAPFGGDSDLGVSEGFGIEGQLYAMRKKVAFVRGAMSLGGVIPEIELKGKAANFDLGAVALKNALVDVKIGATRNQHFRVRGLLKLLAGTKSVDLRMRRGSFAIDTFEQLAGVYRTDYRMHTQARTRPSWELGAKFRNDLSRTLERRVSKRALDWANKTKRDFAAAQRKLDLALGKVRGIDHNIRRTRTQIHRNRKVKVDRLRRAEAKVASLQRSIDSLRRQIYAKRKHNWDNLNKLKAKVHGAHRSWRASIKARKKAKLLQKPKYKAIEAGKFTAYKSAQAAHKTAVAGYRALTKLPIDADPRIASLIASRATATTAVRAARKLVATFPVDADPRIVSLFTARGTAIAALNIAKGAVGITGKAVQGAAKVSAWAAKHNGKLLMLDSASFRSQLKAFLAGSSVRFQAKLRFLGKPQNVRLRMRVPDLNGRLFDNLWSTLRKSL